MDKQKQQGIQHLEEMREIDKLIRKLEEQIAIENGKLTNTAIRYKEIQVQTSGTKDKIGEKGPKIADFQKELERYIQELNEKKRQTLAIMKQMPAIHQQILIIHYLQNKTLKKAAEELKKSERWVRNEKKNALDEFCRIYNMKNGRD